MELKTNADDIKLNVSPSLKFKLNESSDPIIIELELKFFICPFEIKLLKIQLYFFHFY